MRVAVVDLGSNTFNLIIVDLDGEVMRKVFSKKLPAKLGAEAINTHILSEDAITRGIECLNEYREILAKYCPDRICAFATSAVRSALNGGDFVRRAKQEAGFDVKVISGDKEAELIYYGILQSVEFTEEPSLILDIGGGSNEFVLCNSNGVLWKKSFDLGTFRIIDRFKPTYPLNVELLVQMENYFDSQLQPLFSACGQFMPKVLVGASGSFDSFRAMLVHSASKDGLESSASFPIAICEMDEITKYICSLSLEELAQIPGIDTIRVEIITVATVFVWYTVKRLNIKGIIQSNYSLKEGVVYKISKGLPL